MERVIASGSAMTRPWQEHAYTVITIPSTTAIMPVRYALTRTMFGGRNPVKAPPLGGSFKMTGAPQIPASAEAAYTLRRLRSGFLFVFSKKNGADQGWYVYAKDKDGVFSFVKCVGHAKPKAALPSTSSTDSHSAREMMPEDHEPYDSLKHPHYSGMLHVEDDIELWLCFSDVLWPDEEFQKHTDAQFRSTHMRHFNPKALTGDHVAHLSEADKRVAEMYCGGKEKKLKGARNTVVNKNAFDFSRAPFELLEMNGLGADEKEIGKGAMIALDDPAGIAMDLANLMTTRYTEWMQKDPDPWWVKPTMDGKAQKETEERIKKEKEEHDKWQENREQQKKIYGFVQQDVPEPEQTKVAGKPSLSWTMYSLGGIEKTKNLLRDWAKDDVISKYRSMAPRMYDFVPTGSDQMTPGPDGRYVRLEDEAKRQNGKLWRKYYAENQGKINREIQAAWEKAGEEAEKCLDLSAFATWDKGYKAAYGKFEKDVLIPLEQAFLSWVKGERFKTYFKVMFTENDVVAGTTFTNLLAACFEGVQGWKASFNYLLQCLDEPKCADPNLIQRALVLNHLETIHKIFEVEPEKKKEIAEIAEAWGKCFEPFMKAKEIQFLAEESRHEMHLAHPSKGGLAANADQATGVFLTQIAKPMQASIASSLAQRRTLLPSHVMKAVATDHAILLTSAGRDMDGEIMFFVTEETMAFSNVKHPGRVQSPEMAEVMAKRLNIGERDANRMLDLLLDRAALEKDLGNFFYPVYIHKEALQEVKKIFDEARMARPGMRPTPLEDVVTDMLRSGKYLEVGKKGQFHVDTETSIVRIAPEGEAVPGGMARVHAPAPDSKLSFGISVGGAILAGAGLYLICNELPEAKGFEKDDLTWRRTALLGMVVGSGLDSMGKAMTYLPATRVGTRFVEEATVFKSVGSIMGLAGGTVWAVRDFMKAEKLREDGEFGLFAAYLLSGGLMTGTAMLSTIALLPGLIAYATRRGVTLRLGAVLAEWCVGAAEWAEPLGWIIAVPTVLISAGIAEQERRKKPYEWLKQCCWGVGERFSKMELEAKLLKAIS